MDGAHHEEGPAQRERCLAVVREALQSLVDGDLPTPIPEDGCDQDLLELVRVTNRLTRGAAEINAFLRPLSSGHLESPLPSPDNVMAAPLVEMYRRLGLFVQKAQLVAQGDFSQRLEVAGDFADAFNSMAELLATREEKLHAEIERREQAERRLQRERDLLVAGPLVTLRWDVDDDGTVQYVSPNISAFGYDAADFMSGRRRYGDIIHPDDFDWLVEDGNGKAQTGLDGWTQEYRIRDAAGGIHWVRDYTHAVRDENGAVTCYEGYIIDVTAQKQTEVELRRREEQLRMLSLSDDVTGVYNRRGLFALGEHLMRVARRHDTGLTVLYVDVDGLRRVNDEFGHGQGDEVLRRVACALCATVRESDIVARAGGDEFVVLVEDREDVSGELCRRLRRRLAPPREHAHGPRARVSVGRRQWSPDEPAGLQDLIDAAAADLRAQPRA